MYLLFVKPSFCVFSWLYVYLCFFLLGNSYCSSVEVERKTVGTPKHNAMLTDST